MDPGGGGGRGGPLAHANLLVDAGEAMREVPPERRRLVVRAERAAIDGHAWAVVIPSTARPSIWPSPEPPDRPDPRMRRAPADFARAGPSTMARVYARWIRSVRGCI